MKSKSKIFMLILFLVASLLVGCGEDEDTNDGNDTDNGAVDVDDGDNDNADTGDNVDAVTTPSVAIDKATLMSAASEDGTWIIILTSDLEVDEDVVIEGEFTKPDREDESKLVPAGRKLALYAQDEDRNKTDAFTLTVPKLTIRSKDTLIKGGTVVGDVYVEANGVSVEDGNIDGNVYFSKQEYKDSFTLESGGSVTGNMEISE